MSKNTFTLHDETVNTHKFRMLTEGGDLTEFVKNPVMLLNHDDWSLPIGRWENIRKEDGKILAEPLFDLKDDVGKKVADKVADGFLKAASIGAWPPIEVSDAPELMLPGQKLPTVTKWKAREASIVTIGSNHNALVFYNDEGEKIDLRDAKQILKLFDIKKPNKKESDMSKLNAILKLSDNATQQEVEAVVEAMVSENAQLKQTNAELEEKVTAQEKAEKEAQKAEAVTLTDTAVKDGRINSEQKDTWIKLFDENFSNTKAILEGLPKRKSVKDMIDERSQQSNTNLSDLQKKSWDELDKAGKLIELRDDHPDLYAEKYKEKFGTEPKV